jgi:outer membrane protein assembly factor BamB
MKILHINNNYNSQPLTVDTTNITVDNTHITVDATIIGEPSTYSITITPREYPTEVKFILWDELLEQTISQECTVINASGYMEIPFILSDVNDGTSFEVTVNDLSDKLLWRGKLYCTNQTDMQEFKMNVPNASKIIKF